MIVNASKQIWAVSAVSLSSLRYRLGSATVIVTSMAGAVGVLVAVFGMASGLAHTFAATGHADRAVVLRNGANYEISSTLSPEAVEKIRSAPGIRHGADGEPLVAAEFLTIMNVLKADSGDRTSVSVRGSTPELLRVRPEIKIVQGRMFRAGLREIVVGRLAESQFRGLAIGDRLRSPEGVWTVVGVFDSDGDMHASESITDATTLLSAHHRTDYSSVTATLDSGAALQKLRNALASDPTLNVEAVSEAAHYASQSRGMTGLLYFISYVVGANMAVGALLAAFGAMHAATNMRLREIAVFRAIGFGTGGVVTSVLIEALLLAVLGGILGATGAWLLFSGAALSTLNGGAGVVSSQVVYQINIRWELLATAVFLGCGIGLVGASLPALRAARLPVVTALQAR